MPNSWPKRIFLLLAAVLFVSAGILHFTRSEFFVKIVPRYIPEPLAMVYLSGVCEVLGGIGLLVPMTRRLAGWGLVALLIAVFPANLYMATNPVEAGAAGVSAAIRWGRLPLQPLLIAWVLWVSKG